MNQVGLLLWCFLLLAIAGWALGRWPAKLGSFAAAVLLILVGLGYPAVAGAERAAARHADGEWQVWIQRAANGTEVVWQPYSEQALDAARAAGHPVFIDFTAAWCLSCQVNERLSAWC